MHPFFKLMVERPTAVTDHVEAYASLAALELSTAVTHLKLRALKTGIALCCVAVAAVLAGVSLMLWATTPPADLHAPWALWLAPGVPTGLAVWCWMSARSIGESVPFAALRGQVREDIAMLHEVSA